MGKVVALVKKGSLERDRQELEELRKRVGEAKHPGIDALERTIAHYERELRREGYL